MFVTKHKLEMTDSALRAEIIRLNRNLEQLDMDYKRNTKQLLQLEESNKRLRVEVIRLKDNLEQLDMDYKRNISAYIKQLHQLDESNKRLLDYLNLREENIPAKTVLKHGQEKENPDEKASCCRWISQRNLDQIEASGGMGKE